MFPRRSCQTENPIQWNTLAAYANAMRVFTRSPAPKLLRSSFAQIEFSDVSVIPDADYFDVHNGTLGFRHYKAVDANRVLIMIHGSACFGDLMQKMASTISGQNSAHVYTLDMRGHGLSYGPRGHAVTHHDELKSDIVEFVEYIRVLHPNSKITLGGHSAGGGLVLSISRSEAAQLVDSFLFLAPFLGFGSDVDRPYFGGWVQLRKAKIFAIIIANLLGCTHFNGHTVLDFNMLAAQDGRYVPSWSFSTLLAFGPGRWIADSVPISRQYPVMLTYMSKDECFHQDLYCKAFEHIAPHAFLHEGGNGGHWDLLVNSDMIQAVVDFISEFPESQSNKDRSSVSQRTAA